MTPYQRIAALIGPCRNVADLMYVWHCNQTMLKMMPAADMLALSAMKDHYKRLIADGEIEAYITARAAAAGMYKKVERVDNPDMLGTVVVR